MLALGVAATVVLAAGGLAIVKSASSADMGYLFTELDAASAKNITDKLTASGVKWELAPDGTSIMAPRDQIANLRMQMASEFVAGKIGYEVIDGENPLGLSDQRAKLNHVRAVEGELARSIMTMEAVQSARVHLSMPEKALFAREPRPASAAVSLKVRGQIDKQAVLAIQTLVAASVPDLSPERVSVVDQRARLLSGSTSGAAGGVDDRQSEIETKLRDEVETMLERAAGPGRVRVTVSADLSRAARKDESQKFDPAGQVVARETTVESSGRSREGANAEVASVSTELPENAGEQMQTNNTDLRNSQNQEVSTDTHFNSSVVRSTLVENPGTLQRLTVSVLMDPKTGTGRDLTPQDVEQMTRLVKAAVGFNEARGDVVTIELMPMVLPDDMQDEAVEGTSFSPQNIPWWMWALFVGGLLGVIGLLTWFLRNRKATVEKARVEAEKAQQQVIDAEEAAEQSAASAELPGFVSGLTRLQLADEEVVRKIYDDLRAKVAEDPEIAAEILTYWMKSSTQP